MTTLGLPSYPSTAATLLLIISGKCNYLRNGQEGRATCQGGERRAFRWREGGRDGSRDSARMLVKGHMAEKDWDMGGWVVGRRRPYVYIFSVRCIH